MNRLCLLRHAKAVPHAAEDGTDRDRALNERGRRAAKLMGGWMAEHWLGLELVLCSSAVRTRETLELLLPRLSGAPEIVYEDGLYLAEPGALMARLRLVPRERASILVLGHNPGLHELAARLVEGASGPLVERLRAEMPTAALACFELAGDWTALDRGGARLARYVTPKELARSRD